jgi:2-polyprenyl-6-methoxyphenol hydroxylase-like FAD-dependent oxidoreductase
VSADDRDLLIVGAGPSGLAVAIAAHRAGLDYEVIERASSSTRSSISRAR